MVAADRFSRLSDKLLESVISFLPARDAARTTVLSRRWRLLWLGTDAVNLDSSSYDVLEPREIEFRLFREAGEALHAPGRRPVRKLSLLVKQGSHEVCQDVLGSSIWNRDGYNNLMDSVLADPALRCMEELHIGFKVKKDSSSRSIYELHLDVLPGHTLRVLDLARCGLELPPRRDAFFFPRISMLQLDRCSSSVQDLERFIRAVPNVGSLHIERLLLLCTDANGGRFVLHCPNLTALTWADTWTRDGIDLDAPRLRTFKYNGCVTGFSMRSEATKLTRVDLALDRMQRPGELPEDWFPLFWQFLRSLRHAKVLKMKLPSIEGIAVGKDKQCEHLVMLPSLERLELEGPCCEPCPYRRKDTTQPTTAIANLLQCCPVIQDLQIRFTENPWEWESMYGRESRTLSDFEVCMDLFKRRSSKVLDGDDGSAGIAELHGLTGCSFDCLQQHLRKVKLAFGLKGLDRFEVSLAKFFAENCMVLEVLHIDDGNQNFSSHLDHKAERWRANASKQRKHV